MRKILIALIKVYRFTLSPFIGQHCRFTPTCSQYATEAIEQYGAIKGSWMAAKRLSKCHPFHSGGWDPVPENMSSDYISDEDVSLDDLSRADSRQNEFNQNNDNIK